MKGSPITSVSKLSTAESYAVAHYLYRLYDIMVDSRNHYNMLHLFCPLLDNFKKDKRVYEILEAYIKLLIKDKNLTPRKFRKGEKYETPFSLDDKLKYNFVEDKEINERCRFGCSSDFMANCARLLYVDGSKYFGMSVAQIFFLNKAVEDIDLKKSVTIPARIKKYINDTSQINFLSAHMKLSEKESRLLLAIYRCHAIRQLKNFYEDIQQEGYSPHLIYATMTCMTESEVRQLLMPHQKLVRYGLAEKNCDMSDDIIDCIANQDLDGLFGDVLQKCDTKNSYELSSYCVPDENVRMSQKFLKQEGRANILLHGKPGSGKTEFAKSLAESCGKEAFVFKNASEVDDDDGKNKFLARLNCLLSMKKENAVIIVDEAESVLATALLSRKGTVNKMLEESENKVIWIVNYLDAIDESTLRRFSYSIKFNKMPQKMLRSIADTKLQKIEMGKRLHSKILNLCGKYHVTGASIDYVVAAISGMNMSSEKEVVADVKNLLEANSTLLYGTPKFRETVSASYDARVLNTSISAEEILAMTENAVSFSKRNKNSKTGIRMLFYGLSGTGKTEFARYISQRLGKEILLKRASDILDMYVGGSEKNIRNAFDEAEGDDKILLFDEADSFFADRNSASQYWERTMVNEFLTQMEEFSGILICTTNLRNIMDAAMQRRFHIMVEFNALTENGIKTLLEKYFGKYEFDSEQMERLASYASVTPGDFGSLSDRLRFMSTDKLSSRYIFEELSKLQDEKDCNTRKRIGFAV